MATQLDRIEQKLDRLLSMFGCAPSIATDDDVKSAVYASGGVKALKEFMAAEATRRAAND